MFINRKEAGKRLSESLRHLKTRKPIVIGIARGGVPVAYEIADALESEMTVLVTKKLKVPGKRKSILGNLTEDGTIYFNPFVKCRITKERIERIISETKQKIANEVKWFRHGHELPDLHNRQIILVDDGIVTGSTIMAAFNCVKKQKPGRVIVASPICLHSIYLKLEEIADEVVVLEIADSQEEVSGMYEEFENVSFERVRNLYDTNSAILNLRNSLQYL